MSLPKGEVKQWQVLEWALDQARYLTPTQHHLLLYLCVNAFYSPENPEGAWVGRVLSRRAEQTEIQYRTSLSRKTVYRALGDLQEHAYLIYKPGFGNGYTEITIAWTEQFDELRDQIRAGVKPLPDQFRRIKRTSKRSMEASADNVISLRDRVPKPDSFGSL